jgi:FAD/FMN-containing dehydrogenase
VVLAAAERAAVALDAQACAGGPAISAEQGIGRARAALLHLTRSAVEIAAMLTVKSAFDLDGLLNPAVLFAP